MESALSKLVDTTKNNKYTKSEIIEALEKLIKWKKIDFKYARQKDEEKPVLNEYWELGGPSRFLLFLKNNMNDALYCYHATNCIVSYCCYQHVGKKIIERGGIRILLDANDVHISRLHVINTASAVQSLRAVHNIWMVLSSLVFWRQITGERQSIELIEKDQEKSIIDSCINNLVILDTNDIGPCSNIDAQQLIDSLCDASNAASQMNLTLAISVGSSRMGHFEGGKVVLRCLMALKCPDGGRKCFVSVAI